MAAEYKIIGGDGHEYGPVTLEEIRQWCEDGRVSPATLVWLGEDRRWLPAASRDELKWDLRSPAAPPVLPTVPVAEPMLPAGFWMRSAACIMDLVVVFTLLQLVAYPWREELIAVQKAAAAALESGHPDPVVLFRLWMVMLLLLVSVSSVYFVGFTTLHGATPGKQMLGLRVLNADGSRLTFARALLRYAGECLTCITLGAGFLLVLVTPEKQALHDLLAQTRVVFRPRRFDP